IRACSFKARLVYKLSPVVCVRDFGSRLVQRAQFPTEKMSARSLAGWCRVPGNDTALAEFHHVVGSGLTVCQMHGELLIHIGNALALGRFSKIIIAIPFGLACWVCYQ